MSALKQIICLCIVVGLCIAPVAAQQGSPSAPVSDEAAAVLKLVPAQAEAALIVPNLKTLSDQVTQCLEGMDRANLLLGSRPIDQLKAATGFNVGVNDAGGMAIVALSEQGQQPNWLYIVPVSDAQTFLSGNFASHEGDEYKLPNGATVFAKAIDNHVILSQKAEVVRGYNAGAGMAAALADALGDRGPALMSSGEVFAFGREQGLRRINQAIRNGEVTGGMPLPGAELAGLPVLEDADVGLVSFDFDALGLIVRSLMRFKPETPAAKIVPGTPQTQPLGRLPGKPYYVAASADVAGLGGDASLNALATGMDFAPLPEWASQIHAVQFAAYPSPAGLAGGIMNDAVLVIQTSQPQQVRQAIKQQILKLAQQNNGEAWRVKWDDDKRVNEAVGTADAYEIARAADPNQDFILSMLWQNLFGQSGWRGFVRQTQDAVLVTFSQRPSVLDAAIKAQGNDPALTLRMQPALKTMQSMMAPATSIECFINLSQIAKLAEQIAGNMGQDALVPQFDSNLPPIGIGFAARDRGVESTTIVPAGVLAVALDQAMHQRGADQPRQLPGREIDPDPQP